MGIMVYSLLWVMQDLYHQPYLNAQQPRAFIDQVVKSLSNKRMGTGLESRNSEDEQLWPTITRS